MATSSPPNFGKSSAGLWQKSLSSARRFWEPYRVVYNLILATVVVIWLAGTWPHFRGAIRLSTLLLLAILALLANVCYSVAYLVDIPMQWSEVSTMWNRQRWILWSLGMLFSVVIENYWIADEIYPFVR